MTDNAEALAAHRDALAAQARPVPQNTNLGGRVTEAPDLWRVYRREWIVAHVAGREPGDGDATAGLLARCQAHFNETYAGRVHADDAAYECSGAAPHELAKLLLCVPVMKGEFKTRERAEAFADANGWVHADIVRRNSRPDQELRNYGIKKLPKAGQ